MNYLEAIIEELNESVLSGKFGVDEVYGDLIRTLFHKSDDVRDYLFYEMDSKVRDEHNLHKQTVLEEYCSNICDAIWTMYNSWYNAEEVEIGDDFDFKDGGIITFSVKTLTACSEPEVNYYDDGSDSVYAFIEELKDKIQINNIEYVEDWDIDEYGSITRSGYIVIKLMGE